MAEIGVLCTDGNSRSVKVYSITCPCCGSKIVPRYLCYHNNAGVLFCYCPVTGCGEYFMLKIKGDGLVFMNNHPLSKQVFSEIINGVSVSFGKI